MIIVLDAGHGLHTAGKRCLKSIDPNETREWVLNSRIADMAEKMLTDKGHTVIRVDDKTGQNDVSLYQRVAKANKTNARVYISIHHNAGVKGKTGGGTIVYWYSSREFARTKQANALYAKLLEHTGLKGNRSAKVVKRGFYVIKHTKMPAFLIENGFMDSLVDTPIILTEEHAIKTANAIVDFVSEFGKKY